MRTVHARQADRTIAVLTFDIGDDGDAISLLDRVRAFARAHDVTILDSAIVGDRLLVALALVDYAAMSAGHADTTMHALLRDLALPQGARVGILGGGLGGVWAAARADTP